MTLVIELLGSPRFSRNGHRFNLSRRKSIALLAYLVVTRQPQSREAVAALLWPELDESAARANLRRGLNILRTEMGEETLRADRLEMAFVQADGVEVDVYQFEQALAEADSHAHSGNALCDQCAEALMTAADLVEGDFMAGFGLPDSDTFEEWLFFEREQRRQELATALRRLADWCGEQGRFDDGIEYGRRWLSLDPWHEPAHRALMYLYAISGQYAAAIRQYHLCVEVLQEELAIEPEPETEALFAAIQSKQIGPQIAEEPAVAALEAAEETASPRARHNLPAFADSFVGRRPEIEEIHQRLTSTDCRLLTLRGIGGIGKTRLAVQALTELADGNAFEDGLFMVNLAGVESTDYLASAVAESLGFPLTEAAEGLDQVATYLRRRELLLFLDNFEQLQSSAVQLATLLQRCRRLKLLVTSRHQLNLAGEHVLVLSGLPVSATDHDGAAAVRLFRERARQFNPQLDVAAQKGTIEEICCLVDGMPLAIEMCAAWVQMLNCQEILAEVRQGLDLLEAHRADAPSRHVSIRAVFPSSFNLLAPAEQEALLTLAIFRGSFDQAAARDVAGANLGHLRALVEKSLLGVVAQQPADRPAGTRYQMHPLLRQFALEQIDDDRLSDGEARYAAYYAALLAGLATKRCAPENSQIVSTVSLEVDNLRAIWNWLGEQVIDRPHEVAGLLRQMLPAWSFAYLYKTDFLEGRQILGGIWQALDAAGWVTGDDEQRTSLAAVSAMLGHFCGELSQFDDVDRLGHLALPVLREKAEDPDVAAYASDLLRTWARIDMRRGDYTTGREKLDESVRRAPDDFTLAMALHGRGTLFSNMGDYERALGDLNEALRLHQKCFQEGTILTTLAGIGAVYGRQGHFEEAITRYEELVPLARRYGQRVTLMAGLNNLAFCLRMVGRNRRVEALFSEALAVAREMGKKRWQAVIGMDLGWFYLEQGETGKGKQFIQDGLRLAVEIDSQADVLAGLLDAGRWLAQTGKFEQALVMAGYVRDAGVATAETEKYAAEFWDELAGELPPAVVQRAEHRLGQVTLEELLTLALAT